MNLPARPSVQPSREDECRARMVLRLVELLDRVDGDYARLFSPDEPWLNTFLGSEILEFLRRRGVSWKNQGIQRLFRPYISRMNEAGVSINEDSVNDFIVFVKFNK